ncbi:MAG TPA: methyltransferase domain-containing protein, partial [Deferrisomatales bacterium]|nr:methyltransferase domain-containing protein [Deferrisomatales bacterium]
MLERSRVLEVLGTYQEAWEGRDPEKILSIFTEDATYREKAFEEPASGHGGIRDSWLRTVVRGQADIRFTLLNLYVDGDTAVAEWEARFNDLKRGVPRHIREVAILEFRGGKICSLREYWSTETHPAVGDPGPGARSGVVGLVGRLRRRAMARYLGLGLNAGRAKRMVGAGYDAVADEYALWTRSTADNWRRERWAAALADSLPRGATVLDLGCGAGAEAAAFAEQGFEVTGVDLSRAHIERARHRLPGARFLCADMAALELPSEGFDAVTAFYSLLHLPRREQPRLMAKVCDWLRPGGLFLGNLAARPFGAMYEADWLGAPMYWSS